MKIYTNRLPVFAASILAFGVGTNAWGSEDRNEISECDLFIEINATDEDAGWQGLVDGSPWKTARIIGPDDDDDSVETYRHPYDSYDETLLIVRARDDAREQGMTEYRWESAEPTFDEFALADFLERFPAGEYRCVLRFIEGRPRKARAVDELTHCLPDGPVISDPGVLPAGANWTVMWQEVTTQYDPAGAGMGAPLEDCDPEDELVKYGVTVEFENGVDKVLNLEVLPPDTMATISGDFLDCGLSGKVEIGAFLDSGNSSFREIEIATEDCGP